jgi:hypothetical protein
VDEQLLRITLPTSLLTQVDRHLADEGSSRTRADFVREAVEQRLLELRFGSQEPAEATTPAVPTQLPSPSPAAAPAAAPEPEFPSPRAPLADDDDDAEDDLENDPLISPRRLADTALVPIGKTWVDPSLVPGFHVEPGQLFLHGRDYPSFWGLAWLARWSDEAPLELSDYLRELRAAAWRFARALLDFDRAGPLKASTTFPTNASNKGSASQTFEASAIGGVIRRRDGSTVAVGPLALWQVAHFYQRGSQVLIGPTELGVRLLERLEGLSLELPHDEQHARVFLDHLREYAPIDHDGLRLVLGLVAHAPRRTELIDALKGDGLPGWQKLEDVYAQSYVSRGREWGLIEPKMIERRYHLTEFGATYLAAL